MDSDGCEDITRKPSIGREEGLHTATPRSVAVDTAAMLPPLAPAQAPALATTTGLFSSGSRLPNHRHKHTPSAASSVFDDSDESSDEQSLARRSARMYPRIAPAPKAVPQATAAAANDISSRLDSPLPPPAPTYRGRTVTRGLTTAPSDTASVVTVVNNAAATATMENNWALLQQLQVRQQQLQLLSAQLFAQLGLTSHQLPSVPSSASLDQQILLLQQQQLLMQQQLAASINGTKVAAAGIVGTAIVGQPTAALLPSSILGSSSYMSNMAEHVGGDVNVASSRQPQSQPQQPQPQQSQPQSQKMLVEKYLRQWSEVQPIPTVPSAAAGASPSTFTTIARGFQTLTPAAASAGLVGLAAGDPGSYNPVDASQGPAVTTAMAPPASGRTGAAVHMPASAATPIHDAPLPPSSQTCTVPDVEAVTGDTTAAQPAVTHPQPPQLTVSHNALPAVQLPTSIPVLPGGTVRWAPVVPPLQLMDVVPAVPPEAPSPASSRLQPQPFSTVIAASAQPLDVAVAMAPTPPPLQKARSPQRPIGGTVGEEVEGSGVDARPTETTSGLDDKDKDKRKDLPSDDLVAENLAGNIDAIAIFEQDEDDEDPEAEEELSPPWFRQASVLWFLSSMGVGVILLVVGVILHIRYNSTYDAFRWCYFFAAMPLLYYALSYVSAHAFMVLEWCFFRESLFYLLNVQRSALWLLFFLALLPWYQTVFRWAWCQSTSAYPRRCQQPAYVQATLIVWNLLLCLMLFCLANLLKAVLAKLLTTHFYRTAHFNKLKSALEKEYALQVLSRPRREIMSERAPAQGGQQGGDGIHHGAWYHLTSYLNYHHHHHHHHHHHSGSGGSSTVDTGGGGVGGGGGTAAAGPGADAAMVALSVVRINTGGRSGISLTRDAIPEGVEEAEDEQPRPRQPAVGTSGSGRSAADGADAALGLPQPQLPPPQPPTVPPPGMVTKATAPLTRVASSGLAAAAAAPASPPATATLSPAQLPPGSPVQPPDSNTEIADSPQRYLLQPPLQQEPPLPPPPPAGITTSLGITNGSTQLAVKQSSPKAPTCAYPTPTEHDAQIPQPPLQPLQTHVQPPSQAFQVPASLELPGARELAAHGATASGLAPGGKFGPGSSGGGWTGVASRVPEASAPGSLPLSSSLPVPPSVQFKQQQQQGAGPAVLLHKDSRGSRASKASKVSAVKTPKRAPTGALNDATSRTRKGSEALTQAMATAVVKGTQTKSDAPPPGNILNTAAQQGLRHLSDAELEKVRTAIVIKTQSALISKYTDRSDEDMAKELGRVKRFAKALFYNVLPPDSGRDYITEDDFIPFFMAAEGGGGGVLFLESQKLPSAISSPHQSKEGASVAVGGSGGAGGRSDGNTKTLTQASLTKFSVDPTRAARQRARQRAAEEAAKKAFVVFDFDNNGQVSRSEVKDAVVNIYNERRNMARSLADTDTIVQSLEFGIGGVIHFVFAAVYLLIWGVDLLTGFSTFSATVLALTFVFGNSVKNMYESMLFLFVTHPYDVGDCILVGTDMFRVKKISLLYTDMVKSTGERMYMPNTSLITQGIINWTRSKTKSESCRLVCDIGVAWDVREDMQAALRSYAKEHPGEFDGEPSCNFRELVDPLKVVLVCTWTYNFAPDDFSRLSPSRNGMLFIVQSKAREHRLHHTTYMDNPGSLD